VPSGYMGIIAVVGVISTNVAPEHEAGPHEPLPAYLEVFSRRVV
jgi:hypothetical protein